MREKLITITRLVDVLGITPACAGKTLFDYDTFTEVQDHPRVCGKNFESKLATSLEPGSPPRVREKHIFERP